MKVRADKTIGCTSLSLIIIASIFGIMTNTTSYAEGAEQTPTAPSAASTESGSGSDDIAAASGSNRFVVWSDSTPGNDEIFFRRSTDGGASWEDSVNLSNNPGRSLTPQIAISGTDVYVIWLQLNTQFELPNVILRHSADNGATWGAKIKISSSGTVGSDSPRVAASGDNVYVVWDTESGNSDGEIFFRRSTDNGDTWKAEKSLSNNAGRSEEPRIATSGSKLYVVWRDDSPGNGEAFIRRSTDNGATWKPVKNLSNNQRISWFPEVAASGSNVYVVWQDGLGGKADILLRRSTDNGATWVSKVNLSNNEGASRDPQVAASGSAVYVAWRDNTPSDVGTHDILFRRSNNNGATWEDVANLSDNAGDSSYPRLASSGDSVHVLWRDHTPGNYDIFYRGSTDGGETWVDVRNLSDNEGDSDNQRLAVAGDNVYSVWHDLTPGDHDILLRRSIDDGATWEDTANLSDNAGSSAAPQIGV